MLLVDLEHSSISQRQDVQIRPSLFLVLLQLLHSSLQRLAEILNAREKGGDFGENDQGIPDEQVIAALQAVDDGLGDLEVPFVADVAVVFKVEVVFAVGDGGVRGGFSRAAAENRLESRVVDAFLVVDLEWGIERERWGEGGGGGRKGSREK